MRRSQRISARESQEGFRQRNLRNKAVEKERQEQQRLACQVALKKPRGPEVRLSRAGSVYTETGHRLLQFVAKHAPRLLTPDYQPALVDLARIPWVRSLEDWKPKGKGRDALFRSLASFLVASYPMPNIIWGALFGPNANRLLPIVQHVVQGGSLFKAVQSGLMPVPLTRAQCHEFLQMPGDRFMESLRRVQIRTFGGDPQLLAAWIGTDAGGHLHDRATEEFWLTVLRWFCQNPMLDRHQVGPLMDFIGYRRRNDPDFSMKGRSALALLEAMKVWHGNLAKEKSIHGIVFEASGFKGGTYEVPVNNNSHEVWRVTEILSSKLLAAEGQALSHCVYSYAWSIEAGAKSIWSLTCDDVRHITLEVRNNDRCIVQARGRFNRVMTHAEHKIVLRWAAENGLGVSTNRL